MANLNVELYREDEKYCAYLSDNNGGSGIEVNGNTPEECCNELSKYIEDYFYFVIDDDEEED